MNRRNLIRVLLGFPFVAKTVSAIPVRERLVQLPIGCDLSWGSLAWALETGKKNFFGEPVEVLINPEDRWIAKEMGLPDKKYTGDSNVNALLPPFRVVYGCRLGTWRVVFERGVVESQGPF